MSTRALIDERASLAKDAEKILTTAVAEQRELTAEENDRFDRIHEKVDALRDTIDRAEKQDKLTKELSEIRATSETKAAFTPGAETADADAKDKRHGEAFRAWMRDGMSELTPEQRTIMGEHRAQGTTPDTAGGYLVSAEFSNQLEAHLSAFGGMREAARVIQTATGADLHWPTTDDTFNEGELVAENTAVADQDVLYGEIVFSSYLYSSKMVRSSRSLLQDTNLFEGELSRQLAERIGRITNRHFTTGTGTGEPEGVVTAAGGNDLDGNALAAGTLGAIAYDDLVNLEHGVDPAYRASGNARFMFSDAVLKVIKKIVDSTGRPLWQPQSTGGLANRQADTVLGYPYTINQDMAGVGASEVSACFGDFSRYIIRDALGITMLRLVERYAEFLQVGFLMYSRHDGRALFANDATNSTDQQPIKKLTQPAS